MGIFTQLYGPLAGGVAVGVYAPQEPRPPIIPTPNNILETTRITGCDALMSVPSIIEVCYDMSASLRLLINEHFLDLGAGPGYCEISCFSENACKCPPWLVLADI